MRVLFIGDIFGRPGRTVVHRLMAELREEFQPSLIVANAENATHGTGMTRAAFEELSVEGIHVFTGGNHTLGKHEILILMDEHPNVLCPGNASLALRRHGWFVWPSSDGPIGIVNVIGQYCMSAVDSPYDYLEDVIGGFDMEHVVMRFVDIHAEATAEKAALLHLFDGRVSVIVGTHTHVPTADARVTEKGTAFITDVGMTGVMSSIIGLDPETVLRRIQTGVTYPPHVAEGEATLMAVVVDIDPLTGKSTSILPLQRKS
ncbi:YmdB family metallophosphoesterase [bacterium]|nr:YmdB family metallophosphoesterase [bacterium]